LFLHASHLRIKEPGKSTLTILVQHSYPHTLTWPFHFLNTGTPNKAILKSVDLKNW